MIPFAAPPSPTPASQQIVVTDARTVSAPQAAANPLGNGGRRTFANRHERRAYLSLVRRERRKRWRQAGHSKLNALVICHQERLSLSRAIRAINERAASLTRRTPARA